MKTIILIKKEVDIKTCLVKAAVRYWEDATVNGVTDENGDLIPCRQGDLWCPEIDIDNGKIVNWTEGVEADVHFKVCDAGSYYLKDNEGNIVQSIENYYVPNDLIPGDYGDYIIMNITKDGTITNWPRRVSFDDFHIEED